MLLLMVFSGNDISYITKWAESAEYLHLCVSCHANSLQCSYHGLRKGKGTTTSNIAFMTLQRDLYYLKIALT